MKSTIILIGMLATYSAFAITKRHDRSDKEYLDKAKAINQVCKLGKAGDATLVRRQWLITAAHVANSFIGRLDELTVEFAGKQYKADKIFLHPQWTDMGPHDIALIHLTQPVSDIEPIGTYKKRDENGKNVLLVGHGDTRTGLGGEWKTDFTLRAATNIVDEADEKFIIISFTEPPAGTYLEGVSGRGDSGGPVFIEINRKFYIAGVSSVGQDGKNGPATYGAKDYYTRVSMHMEWIYKVLASKVTASPTRAKDSFESNIKDTIPNTPAGKRLKSYIAVIEKNSEQALLDFINSNFSPKDLEGRPAKERRAINTIIPNGLRGATFIEVVESKPNFIIAKFKTKNNEYLNIGMECEMVAPFWLLDVFRN